MTLFLLMIASMIFGYCVGIAPKRAMTREKINGHELARRISFLRDNAKT